MKHTLLDKDGEEKLIPCEDYQLINLLSNIQDRLDIDNEDVAELADEYRLKNRPIWGRRINEKHIEQFKQGKKVETFHQMQIANFIIKNMNKGDLEVKDGIRKGYKRRRSTRLSKDKQVNSKKVAKGEGVSVCTSGITSGIS